MQLPRLYRCSTLQLNIYQLTTIGNCFVKQIELAGYRTAKLATVDRPPAGGDHQGAGVGIKKTPEFGEGGCRSGEVV